MKSSRIVQEMQMQEAARLALSAKLSQEEHLSRVAQARETQREKGLEKAILKMRIWNAVRCSHRKLDEELNRMEGEGWTLVNILENGIDGATIVSARVVEMELPDEPEVTGDPDVPKDTTEFTDTTEAEEEAARQAWNQATSNEPDDSGAVEGA